MTPAAASRDIPELAHTAIGFLRLHRRAASM